MGRRTLLLIASILVAAVGTTLIFMYVKSARNTTERSLDLVKVVVAKRDIAQGDSVSSLIKNDAFTYAEIPRGTVTGNNYEDLAKLAERTNDVASSRVPQGAFIYDTTFDSQGSAASTDVPAGLVAASVQLSDEDRSAAMVGPGSQVAVIATGPVLDAKGVATERKAAVYLMTGISVLRVGNLSSDSVADDAAAAPVNGKAVDVKVVTLAVTPVQALNLKLANNTDNQLALVLLGPDAKITAQTSILGLKFAGNTP